MEPSQARDDIITKFFSFFFFFVVVKKLNKPFQLAQMENELSFFCAKIDHIANALKIRYIKMHAIIS